MVILGITHFKTHMRYFLKINLAATGKFIISKTVGEGLSFMTALSWTHLKSCH
jgi:hypothetical protein